MQDNDDFIISSEVPKMKNMYLEQEENTEEAALSKKRASKSKNTGQKIGWPEKRQEYEC